MVFGKNDNVATSIWMFKEMKDQGLRPGVITSSSLINGFCVDGKIDEMIGLRDEMLQLCLELILLHVMH